jgi:hypothetical protein|tara:strand:- start:512 stop:742 length:231 start_codon:yes stop_codon:yes gene_type:complete
MKKYLITLAAMALAIGGSINFSGCSGEPAIDPKAVKGEEPVPTGDGMTEEEKAEAKKMGFDIGNKNTKEGTEKPGK